MTKRGYTLSRAAHRQRKAAAAGQGPATDYIMVRMPRELHARIAAQRASEDEAIWRVIERRMG